MIPAARLAVPALLASLLPAAVWAQAAPAPTADTVGRWASADGAVLLSVPWTAAPAPPPMVLSGDGVPDEGGAATLLADRITLSGDRRLEASGGVVLWYRGARLVAERVVFEGASDRVLIEGPIHLTRPDETGTDDQAVLVADSAELDQDLRGGILRGARLVLARELQLGAREVRLTGEGRLDAQTPQGKLVARLAAEAGEVGTPVAVLAGQVALAPAQWRAMGIARVYSLTEFAGSARAATDSAGAMLERLARAAAADWPV